MQDHRRRHVSHVLSNELSFLRLGGYGRPFRRQWRPTLVFRDSPLCVNFDSSPSQQSCERCPVFEFIPEDKRQTFVPCHHIPLNPEGETIASLYRNGTQEQLDRTVRNWLEATIDKLQQEKNSHEHS
jgi:hypothetical protein